MNKNEAIKYAEGLLVNIPDKDESIKYILSIATGKGVSDLHKIDELTLSEFRKFDKLTKLRARHVPLDKLIGYKYFFDVKIPFNKNVLTPRQETEILTDMVIKDIKKNFKNTPPSVLDLCSGSGCIGLAIASNTGVNVTLADISAKAIKISKKNNKLNDKLRLKDSKPPLNINYYVSDLFEKLEYKFDIIVCNPPYIKTQDLQKLEIEVKDFDPMLALDGGKDGLDFYRRVIADAPKYLNDGGKIYFEVGIEQGDKVVKLLNKDFEDVQVIKDFAQIDRFIIAKKREKNAK
ncbi:MAG: peptide chain release factor N(5)-glutamine methyltransferase [Clostridiales bacterium]|nr:peptide chain release factor N(5)-glutamine methyltransferase [Clostridiales bacterium]